MIKKHTKSKIISHIIALRTERHSIGLRPPLNQIASAACVDGERRPPTCSAETKSPRCVTHRGLKEFIYNNESCELETCSGHGAAWSGGGVEFIKQ